MRLNKTRVAFFADILTGDLDGAIRTMYQLINRIDKNRFEFLFIHGGGPAIVNGFEAIKVPSAYLPFTKVYSLALPGLVRNSLAKKLQSFSPDVVHIATPSILGHYALSFATANGLPVITIYHTHFLSYIDYYFKYLPFLIKGVRQSLAADHKSFYNRCSKVYVPAKSISAELLAIGVAGNKMKIWKRGMDTTMFSPLKKNKTVMRKITGNDNPVILFVSRLVWEKNLEILFDIVNGFKADQAGVNFVIVGDGSARKDCEEKLPNAFFTGALDHQHLSVLYASADAFVFPSVSETYGNVVLEAMASGLPCVIADGGGSRDFIDQGVNGFKCLPNNAADYIVKLKMLLTNNLLANQFIEAGLAYTQNLSWDNLAEEYFNDVITLASTKVDNNSAAGLRTKSYPLLNDYHLPLQATTQYK